MACVLCIICRISYHHQWPYLYCRDVHDWFGQGNGCSFLQRPIRPINSGIRKILPDSEICDFEFGPCGYSMNAIEGAGISTIHVTPEDGFSYANFEAVGYDLKELNLKQLVERVLVCFKPSDFSVAVHVDVAGQSLEQSCMLDVKGYSCGERSMEELGISGSIMYLKFNSTGSCGSPRSTLKCCWKEEEEEEEEEE